MRVNMRKLLLLICLFPIGLSGCVKNNLPTRNGNVTIEKKVYSGDFDQVCNGGKVAGTAGYDKSPDTISPIAIYFQPDPNAKFQTDYMLDFPKDWKTDYSNPDKTQLVACITVSERKEKKRCNFPQDGKTYVLIMNDAKFNAKVYEAKTGIIVAEKDFDLKADKECPMIGMFTNSEKSDDPSYEQPVINFLKPLVKH